MIYFRAQLLAVAASSLMVACASFPAAPSDSLTVTDARARAAELDGKEVRVSGYLTNEFENNSIWASPADAEHLRQSNCLGLGIPKDMYDKRLNRHWVVLRGKLHVFPEKTIFLNGCYGVGLQLLEAPIRVSKPKG